MMRLTFRGLVVVLAGLIALAAGGCASLPPGADYPKAPSSALAPSDKTALARQFDRAARGHDGNSAFRLLSAGVDGFLYRAQMIDAAQRTIDLEYFIFRQDDTGQLLTDALLRAADRGVRIRLLIDDADTQSGDGQIAALSAHPNIHIRIFNPFSYRGHADLIRDLEFAVDASRLDYRMHNKLMVVDNTIALVGGRNIGDQYFQVDPDSQFGDDDVFAAGPIVRKLSASFDDYWNSRLAIPVEALAGERTSPERLAAYRASLEQHRRALKADGIEYARRIATGEPLASVLSGRVPLVWAHAEVLYDSPDKKQVEKGDEAGSLMHRTVMDAARAVRSELLIVTPFFVPGADGMQMLSDLRKRGVRVAILTNSLESTPEPIAQAGYVHYRYPLLEDGVELYEVRARLGNARGSGETTAAAAYGHYALHAKLFVFDRKRLFVGSMNFDERSRRINTEMGMIIDSPALARQAAARFEAIASPANSYQLALRSDAAGGLPQLVWRTQENGNPVEYESEPTSSVLRQLKMDFLSLLPLDGEL
ncbi:MAG: phospholipase D family protein [Candidatus Levyibacteriota bacterium]